ncbi:TPA: hypothetical protein IX478_001816 [Enterococcus faecium]|uniref:phospholipase A2 family protein n=1 Tax=Enterococcus TaxID=1350 RepID=UPI000CD47623|nr:MULTISPECIES: phospholipase A2 family protein [Enterococcus]MDT2681190.1 phospholipase A2 family protein [Enterococcus gallinarum]MDT2684797.1 phospholipase A2 family protein [Enterococcus gallinarum]POH50054.1 hypothetical protein CV740_14945 [Enterococcus faecium]HAQ6439601.1 hypothetical protein [Enterococcus faecium]HAQ6572530.1 hypothetical protein [Enterococcus faecium]
MSLRVSQYSKFLYLIIGLVATLSILFGISIKGYADEKTSDVENSVYNMDENQILNIMNEYIYINENGIREFDLNRAIDNNLPDEILEIGNTMNNIVLEAEKEKKNDNLTVRIVKRATFLVYGNYCGYGNKGKGKMPIDDLDTACMYHDYCYVHGGNNTDCNRKFADRLRAVIKSAKKFSYKYNVAVGALAIFG